MVFRQSLWFNKYLNMEWLPRWKSKVYSYECKLNDAAVELTRRYPLFDLYCTGKNTAQKIPLKYYFFASESVGTRFSRRLFNSSKQCAIVRKITKPFYSSLAFYIPWAVLETLQITSKTSRRSCGVRYHFQFQWLHFLHLFWYLL